MAQSNSCPYGMRQDIDALKRQIEEMQKRIDRISDKG